MVDSLFQGNVYGVGATQARGGGACVCLWRHRDISPLMPPAARRRL